jgi:hypothetical protein
MRSGTAVATLLLLLVAAFFGRAADARSANVSTHTLACTICCCTSYETLTCVLMLESPALLQSAAVWSKTSRAPALTVGLTPSLLAKRASIGTTAVDTAVSAVFAGMVEEASEVKI